MSISNKRLVDLRNTLKSRAETPIDGDELGQIIDSLLAARANLRRADAHIQDMSAMTTVLLRSTRYEPPEKVVVKTPLDLRSEVLAQMGQLVMPENT